MIRKLEITNYHALHELFTDLDKNIKILEENLNVTIRTEEGVIVVEGDNADTAIKSISVLLDDASHIDSQRVEYVIDMVEKGDGQEEQIKNLSKNHVVTTFQGRPIKPKTIGQRIYVESINTHELVFGIGPAGTGKTFLAVAQAIKALKTGAVQKIIITRPAVEAGENLGFLPGDLQSKVNPYLRPIFDAMHEILGIDTFNNHRERGVIEIAPLAYMRGRTLDHAFVILDEAQNTTKEQMKMFLTRFGAHSKVVVNGDISQIDLPRGKKSGLTHALRVLKGIKEIDIVEFSEADVVRHSLVKKIIQKYKEYEDRHGEQSE
ncbi:MAG: PhoH family protein [Bacillota bacterium]|nr:PhoH family protein [Bacillota bacterium]